jgi:hypothetical protein
MQMKTKASLVVMSHLSDVQEMFDPFNSTRSKDLINFVKYIILQCKGDLNQEINPDEMYKEFLKRK